MSGRNSVEAETMEGVNMETCLPSGKQEGFDFTGTVFETFETKQGEAEMPVTEALKMPVGSVGTVATVGVP